MGLRSRDTNTFINPTNLQNPPRLILVFFRWSRLDLNACVCVLGCRGACVCMSIGSASSHVQSCTFCVYHAVVDSGCFMTGAKKKAPAFRKSRCIKRLRSWAPLGRLVIIIPPLRCLLRPRASADSGTNYSSPQLYTTFSLRNDLAYLNKKENSAVSKKKGKLLHEEGYLFEERALRHEDIVDKLGKRSKKKI